MNAMRKERWAATLNSFSLVFPRDPPKIGLVSSCHEVRDSDRAVLGGDRARRWRAAPADATPRSG